MCVEIVVYDVISTLCRLRTHSHRSVCALECEPRQPTNLPSPGAVITPTGIIVPAVVALAISVAGFVDYCTCSQANPLVVKKWKIEARQIIGKRTPLCICDSPRTGAWTAR
ncbi:MAG: hypothetical protein NG747_05650 [Candidatus Brocadia sp.]|nr:hypothetical protein [Candidatus Brocadia sp.]